jgi:putative endonuclease
MDSEPTWWTYILQCSDGSYYIGSSANLASRVRVHQAGNGPAYTAQRLPVQLVYSEPHESLQAAVARERQIKRWTHAKKAALIAGDREHLHNLSRCRQSFRL